MWKVGDKVVVTQGFNYDDAVFKTGAIGTVIRTDVGATLSVLVKIDGTQKWMWFRDLGNQLVWEEIVCERARKRKNNYY